MKRSMGARALVVPTPVYVVGTYDADGVPNVMTVAWGGICCSKPPCLAISVRAATYTHGNLMARRAFTVNVPGRRHVREADYFGIASGRDGSKFTAAGLTPVPAGTVDAPAVAEFPLSLECRVVNVAELGLHTQFVGEIIDVQADDSVLDAQGRLDAAAVDPLVYAPEDGHYYALGERLGKAFTLGRDLRK